MSNVELPQRDVEQHNDMAAYWSYKITDIDKTFLHLPHKIIGLFCGNQKGKTAVVAYSFVRRILGNHPVAVKNVNYVQCKGECGSKWAPMYAPRDGKCDWCGAETEMFFNPVRVFRFASETLPGDTTGDKGGLTAEVKNTQYPEFKKWLPPFLVKKDITSRSTKMLVADPFGGQDIVVEFVSYNQSVQSTAGTQKLAIWCVAEGQRVLMADGVWRPIQDIRKGDELICESLGGPSGTQKNNTVVSVIDNGEKEVIKIKCQKGIEFEVTPDHLVMVPDRKTKSFRSYKKAGELNPGDKIICKISEVTGGKTLEDWEVATLATLIGDGCLTQGTPLFYSASDGLPDALASILPDHLKIRKFTTESKSASTYYLVKRELSRRPNPVAQWLKNLGLWGLKADRKFIPEEIFRQDNNTIALFLGYLYATDGWASGHVIGYATTSERLANDLFLLLRRLGVRSSVSTKDFKNGWSKQWHIFISQAEDVIRFSKLVTVIGKEEAFADVVLEAKRRMESNYRRGGFGHKKNDKTKKHNNWVRVKNIEKVGAKKVYDLAMEKTRSPRNNFLIQGGVVVHNCDEQPQKAFYDEQLPRLLAADGDLILTLTPADFITWVYDEIFDRASAFYRSQVICEKFDLKQIEVLRDDNAIAVVQAATDDNPTLKPEAIERIFESYDDPDVIAIRRYGVFKQISGRIFKAFEWNTHIIDERQYFPDGIPWEGTHGRGIDYHERTAWAIGWLYLNEFDELFVYDEYNPSPEHLVTEQIARETALKSGNRKYRLDLIDPLAAKVQPNTGLSVVDDLNRLFAMYRREGICTGAYWQVWDTKGTRGRENIRERLKNSVTAGKPFNNVIVKNGKKVYLPTIWIFSRCKQFANSFKNWRWDEWADSSAGTVKEEKNTAQQRYSHFPMVVEAFLKDNRFRPTRGSYWGGSARDRGLPDYFKRDRVYA